LLPYTQYVAALQVFWLFFCIPSICVYVPDILFPFVVQMCLHFLMPSPPILAQCALDISIAATKVGTKVTSGENTELFSVDFEHNGLFCGDGVNRSYIGSTHDIFDFCQSDSWSLAKIGYCLNYLGYNVEDPALSVYWCFPGKDIVDGLVQVNTPEVCAAMVNASKETKTLCLMVDEKIRLKSMWGDHIVNGCPELPRVLSPRKMSSSARSGEGTSRWQSSGKEKLEQHEEEEDEERGEAEQTNEDDETDPEFYGSDYDVEDGDDDLFLENVDKTVGDHNENEGYVEEEDALDDDDINLSAEELSKLRYTFSAFNPELDMANPTFKVGMVFGDMKELRKALDAYSVRHRVKICKTRNESERLNAECSDGRPWHLKASKDNRTGSIVVRQYNGTHNCKKIWDSKCLTVKLLTEKFIEEFRDNQKMDLGTFGRKVQREFKLLPNKMKLSRARKAALEIIHGDEVSQYSKLWNFGQELRRSNPGSRFILCTTEVKEKDDEDPKDHLSSMYCSFVPAREVF
uniref:Transposase MuDR plant domain-containing protein n=1 Tax=Aegilops tauschii subsp. strangulata TaxID=200361 RepID=A0A453S6S5_AEGTS